MKKVLYAKYNSNRKKEYQIKTTIYDDNGKRYVQKEALTEDAKKHIKSMSDFYDNMSATYKGIELLQGKYLDGQVEYEYIAGKTVRDILVETLECETKEKFLSYFEELINKLFEVKGEMKRFAEDSRFIEVFGEANLTGELCSTDWTNIDLIFDNILFSNDKYICIDYEWVFDFPIPMEYVKYRSIFYFYTNNRSQLEQHDISEAELYTMCGLNSNNVSEYVSMEKNFQNWVSGDDNYCSRYIKRLYDEPIGEVYRVKDELVKHLKELDAEIENKGNRIIELQNEHEKSQSDYQILEEQKNELEIKYKELEEENKELEDKNEINELELGKAEKLIHDKDVHIRNLEAIIAHKDAYIGELEPGYQRWNELYTSPIGKVARLPKRAARKIYHCVKDGGSPKKIIVPSSKNPVVSIVIPVYNQFDYTYNCIQSIIENSQDVPYEIIIGDDVSTDKTKSIKHYIKGITVIRNTENQKFLLNCNNAAKYAKGKYILFLNNDTKVTEGWLSSLVELIESDERIGMVGSKLIYPDGRLQEAGGIIWKDASAWNYGNGEDAEFPSFNYVREVDYISGAAIMIRSELWKQLGGFDELFAPAYCEDSDLAFQVRKAGFKVVYQPKSVVIHFEGVSNGTDTSKGLKHYQVVNNEKLAVKWADELQFHYNNGEHVLKAKDRCYQGKKTILFIDHYVPQFDKDAGSRTVYQYVKMFVSKGYSVKFIGDNYYKHEPYTTILNQMGVEVLHGPWYAENIFRWLDDNAGDIDYVFMNRPHITEKYIDYFKERTNVKIIYYGHDLHFLRISREYELSGDDSKRIEANGWKLKEMDIMHKADVVYYPSNVEVDLIKGIDPNIYAKALVPYVYDEFEDYERCSAKNEGIVFVGGFAHTPNVDAVKWFVEEVYPLIKEKSNIPFSIVGSNPPEEILALEGDGIEVKGFVSDEELEEIYRTCKLVVVPLRYGAGVKGKVIEAIHNGVPIVTTNVGAEGIPEIHSVLEVQDEPEEFAKMVVQLYNDNQRLDSISKSMQAYIREHNSIEAAWKVIGNDFE